MRGSKIAAQIEYEQRQRKFWEKKAKRMKCKVDGKMQCDKCQYKENCIEEELI